MEKYEEKCPYCNGTGQRSIPGDLTGLYSHWCRYCKGKGKIDWVDKIKGQHKCDYCSGKGFRMVNKPLEFNYRGMVYTVPGRIEDEVCQKCEGTGKIGYERQVRNI